MHAGFHPTGLRLRRTLDELPLVPLDEDVWPKFLRGSTVRVPELDGAS